MMPIGGTSHIVSKVRTRYFDDFLTAACREGCGQVVALAAGLDTRAYRLDWSPGVRLFEIDQPNVLAFKSEVLDSLGATAARTRYTVGVNLEDDWPAALREAGFDPSVPTAWLAEGLLMYLPAEAETQLYAGIHDLSAPVGDQPRLDRGGATVRPRPHRAGDRQCTRTGHQDGRGHGVPVRPPPRLTTPFGIPLPVQLSTGVASLACSEIQTAI